MISSSWKPCRNPSMNSIYNTEHYPKNKCQIKIVPEQFRLDYADFRLRQSIFSYRKPVGRLTEHDSIVQAHVDDLQCQRKAIRRVV